MDTSTFRTYVQSDSNDDPQDLPPNIDHQSDNNGGVEDLPSNISDKPDSNGGPQGIEERFEEPEIHAQVLLTFFWVTSWILI